MKPDYDLQTCEVCGTKTSSLRRGRCWGCYIRWSEDRPVGRGATCVICSELRRENLRLVEFQGTWMPMCHNCAAKTMRLLPVPQTIEGIRQRLTRDRRWNERRKGRKDHRIFAIERRNEERRSLMREVETDWIDATDLILEITELEGEGEEMTRIIAGGDKPSEQVDQTASSDK